MSQAYQFAELLSRVRASCSPRGIDVLQPCCKTTMEARYCSLKLRSNCSCRQSDASCSSSKPHGGQFVMRKPVRSNQSGTAADSQATVGPRRSLQLSRDRKKTVRSDKTCCCVCIVRLLSGSARHSINYTQGLRSVSQRTQLRSILHTRHKFSSGCEKYEQVRRILYITQLYKSTVTATSIHSAATS